MRMEAGLDTGPVLLQRELAIAPDDTGGSLHDKLAALGAQVLGEGLRRTLAGENLVARAQPEAGATYAHKLEKSEARLDWNDPAIALERKVRAFDPWPVAEAELGGERIRVWAARALPGGGASPGAILAASKQGIDVACGEGVLRLTKLQRAGGRVVTAADYLNARPELKRA
jgi:methionyl-tRNA formyltransferase